MVDASLPTRVQLQKTKLNLDVINAFINSTAGDDIVTPDGGHVTPLQVISSIVRLINTNQLPTSTVLDTNYAKTQDLINDDLIKNKANVADVYAKTETLSTDEIQALYPDVTTLIANVKQQVAVWLADQGNPALNDVLTAVVINALASGKIGRDLITTVASMTALANLPTWNGRSVYVKSVGIYVYDATQSQWVLQAQIGTSTGDLGESIMAALSAKADSSSVYTKTEVNTLIDTKLASILEASSSFDSPVFKSMASTSITISLPGAIPGMKIGVGLSAAAPGLIVTGAVTAKDTVAVSFFNFSPTDIALGAITVTVTVIDDVIALLQNVTYLTANSSYSDMILDSYAETSLTTTVTGAQLGMVANASLSTALAGVFVNSFVTAVDTVTTTIFNPTSNPLTLTAGTLSVGVLNKIA
ncbi:MAG: hypothetical protein [Bacteriophage sp.]|nr:MAG: hypothetical protein [Bacteriophage sp.]